MSPAEPSATRANGWLRAAVLAALLLAAALRWWEPALVEFKYDEAHITGLGLDLARGGAPLLLSGGTTFGIQRGALDVYLLALPLKLAGGRVEAAVWFMGALGVLVGRADVSSWGGRQEDRWSACWQPCSWRPTRGWFSTTGSSGRTFR